MQETWVQSWVGKIPWRRERLPPPVFLPEGSHGQRSLVGFSPWGPKLLCQNLSYLVIWSAESRSDIWSHCTLWLLIMITFCSLLPWTRINCVNILEHIYGHTFFCLAVGRRNGYVHRFPRTKCTISFFFFLISWRLITLQYCSGFCHTLTWISLGKCTISMHVYILIPTLL